MDVLSSRILPAAQRCGPQPPLLPRRTGPGHLPGVRPSGRSRGGVLSRPGIARGLRARDLAQAGAFWAGGLGLRVLERILPQAGGGHDLVILGWPGAAWHLEFVGDPDSHTPPVCTVEGLIVFYLGQPAGPALIQRMATPGGRVVPARNSYWDRWGTTIAGPGGYRLVLSHRAGQ